MAKCVVPENIHPPPHKRDWEFWGGGGGGVSKTQKFKAMYEAKLEFPEGRVGGGSWGKSLPWGGIDIFWNHTICLQINVKM